MNPSDLAILLAAIFGTGGIGSFFGVKASLNGTVNRVNRIEDKVDVLVKEVAEIKGGQRKRDA